MATEGIRKAGIQRHTRATIKDALRDLSAASQGTLRVKGDRILLNVSLEEIERRVSRLTGSVGYLGGTVRSAESSRGDYDSMTLRQLLFAGSNLMAMLHQYRLKEETRCSISPNLSGASLCVQVAGECEYSRLRYAIWRRRTEEPEVSDAMLCRPPKTSWVLAGFPSPVSIFLTPPNQVASRTEHSSSLLWRAVGDPLELIGAQIGPPLLLTATALSFFPRFAVVPTGMITSPHRCAALPQ